jgi:hypothetical protein
MSASEKAGILRGTLDLLVLKTLATLGLQHGYGIAQRIQQVSARLDPSASSSAWRSRWAAVCRRCSWASRRPIRRRSRSSPEPWPSQRRRRRGSRRAARSESIQCRYCGMRIKDCGFNNHSAFRIPHYRDPLRSALDAASSFNGVTLSGSTRTIR